MDVLSFFVSPFKKMFDDLPVFVQVSITLVMLLIIGVVLLFRTFKKVPQGSLGIRTMFSRPILHYPKGLTRAELEQMKREDREELQRGPVAIYGRPICKAPGVAAMIPFVNGMDFVGVQRRTHHLDSLVVRLADDSWREEYPNVKATFEVTDPYLAHYRYQNLDEYLIGLVTTAARQILSKAASDGTTPTTHELLQQICAECAAGFKDAGARLIDLGLGSALPVRETLLADALRSKGESVDDDVRRAFGAGALSSES